jgi:phosphate transport system ATP-binding protein
MSTVIHVENLDLFYGDFHALKKVPMDVLARHITALIGPSGCGKSTLLRTLNRMNDLVPGVKITGSILFDGKEVYGPGVDVCTLRKRIGMVFQRPNPFPLSVFDNVAFGLRVDGRSSRQQIQEIVEQSLKRAWLWEPLKDRLNDSALSLPLDQQQRLCIARLLAVEPEVILMDEPCSALDPISTSKIEELMLELKKDYTIVIVTHNMQQAARVSDETGFLFLGKLIEFGKTDKIFTNPDNPMTESYITGRFG